MTSTRIANGDALSVLKQMPAGSVNCCVTSPPYWLLRDYGVAGQFGLEPTPQEYIGHLLEVFSEIRRVLREDGSCWVVLGDTYFGSGRGVGSNGQRKEGFRIQSRSDKLSKSPKSLALIPSRFATAMTDTGWILRNRIIWHKPNVIPSSAKDRFSIDFEEMFFFTKSKQYYFEQQFVPFSPATLARIRQFARNGERFDPARHKSSNSQGSMAVLDRFAASMETKKGANMRTVWTIPVARCVEAHYAVYPERLIETPIKAGCPVGGTVIDPFSGAGTTGIVCERLGRSFLGIELNPAYVEIAKKRIRDARERR